MVKYNIPLKYLTTHENDKNCHRHLQTHKTYKLIENLTHVIYCTVIQIIYILYFYQFIFRDGVCLSVVCSLEFV